MPRINENRVETKVCPLCGTKRPLDWFGAEIKSVEYNQNGTPKKTVRFRKYVACWRCREMKGFDARSPIPKGCECE